MIGIFDFCELCQKKKQKNAISRSPTIRDNDAVGDYFLPSFVCFFWGEKMPIQFDPRNIRRCAQAQGALTLPNF